jgi:4-hydroxy-tetrahydrodipicolinate synthase
VPALITPFKSDESLDIEAFERIAKHLIKQGCDALLVNGTTGEGPTLTLDEKKKLIECGLHLASTHQVPLISGVGSNDTRKSIEEAQAMVALGVETLLVVVPYYNKPSQNGIFQHFSAIAQAVPNTEIMIYNIPGRCGVQMSATTMKRLHEAYPNIIGVKQSCPDMDAVSEIMAQGISPSFKVWCGDDSLTLPMLALGAVGTVSVSAHLIPSHMRQMIQLFKSSHIVEAQALHQAIFQLNKELFFLPNPTVVKSLMAAQGFCQPVFRSPIVGPDETEQARIQQLFNLLNQLIKPERTIVPANR